MRRHKSHSRRERVRRTSFGNCATQHLSLYLPLSLTRFHPVRKVTINTNLLIMLSPELALWRHAGAHIVLVRRGEIMRGSRTGGAQCGGGRRASSVRVIMCCVRNIFRSCPSANALYTMHRRLICSEHVGPTEWCGFSAQIRGRFAQSANAPIPSVLCFTL